MALPTPSPATPPAARPQPTGLPAPLGLLVLLAALLAGLALAGPAPAQSPFKTAIKVNGLGISHYEIAQRARLLQLLANPKDPVKEAEEALINERLQKFAARQMGLSISDEELKAGLEEFATRANLTPEQMIAQLEGAGVARETFEDYVRTALLWRKVVGQRFGARARISDAELDRALALGTYATGISVLVSELIIPAPPGQEKDALELAEYLSRSITTFAEFEEAVLTYSASPTRDRGGRLDWLPLDRLPEPVRDQLQRMRAGQVTRPVQVENAVALFQLRGIRDNRAVAAKPVAVEYATVAIPGGDTPEARKTAAALEAQVDTCSDLKAVAGRMLGPEAFSQKVVPVGRLPRALAREIAGLDANEISVRPAGDGTLRLLMLCGRVTKAAEGDREKVRQILFAKRIDAFAEGYLQELRGDAIITRE